MLSSIQCRYIIGKLCPRLLIIYRQCIVDSMSIVRKVNPSSQDPLGLQPHYSSLLQNGKLQSRVKDSNNWSFGELFCGLNGIWKGFDVADQACLVSFHWQWYPQKHSAGVSMYQNPPQCGSVIKTIGWDLGRITESEQTCASDTCGHALLIAGWGRKSPYLRLIRGVCGNMPPMVFWHFLGHLRIWNSTFLDKGTQEWFIFVELIRNASLTIWGWVPCRSQQIQVEMIPQ